MLSGYYLVNSWSFQLSVWIISGYEQNFKIISSLFRTVIYEQAARQLEFLKGRSKTGPTTDSLADALAIAQHHDAVTGTEQQHVADDYAKRLSIGYTEVRERLFSHIF